MPKNYQTIPFQHTGPHGSVLNAKRCDFEGGVVIRREHGISDAAFARDISSIIGFHATNILPELNGFRGYDAFTIKVINQGE